MCQIISNAKDKENEFEKLLEYLLNSIKEKIQEYSDDPNFNRFMLIQNYIIFFMVLVLNLKKYPTLIRLIFKGKINFFGELRDNLNNMKTRKKIKLLCILTNIFLDEYKELFFSNEDNSLEQLFIDQQTEFSDICSETVTFYDDVTYKKMFETLLKFDISYTNFFSNNNKIKDEDKPSYKLCVSQSLIRVAFSKEKKRFYQEKVKFYEYDLLKRIIDKDMEETRDKFGDEYKTLFRKEDLCDDFIKYMFFIFGNSMLIDCFVMPLKNMLSKIGITDDLIDAKDPLPMKRDITKEEFNTLMGIIIDTLTNKIPDVLKILLKILYESVMKHFTIEKNNYSPLYTSLIFNFLISPRIQMLYSINPLNCVFVRSLNRILRNTCFNSKFAEGDSLYEFNETMETNYNKLQKLVKEKIISITINDDIKNSLKDLFTEKYLIYPRFLFYWDSQLLCATIEGGVEQIINFEQLNATSTPTTD